MLRILKLSLLCFFLSSCMQEKTEEKVAAEHKWTPNQISVLKQFIFPSKAAEKDATNRVVDNKSAAILGKSIFFDKRFSSNQKISCASCHQPALYFTDGLKTAKGIEPTSRNTPTIVNASESHWFFHDGRSDSLWSQALGPLENIKEHGGNRSLYAHTVFNDPKLKQLYEKVFHKLPDLSNHNKYPLNAAPINNTPLINTWEKMHQKDRELITTVFVNIGKSIAAYEQFLKPGSSRVDNYIKNLVSSNHSNLNKILSTNEANGLRLFIGKANCTICHIGPTFSDSEFHNIATVGIENKPYDWGRYNGAKEVLKSEFNCKSKYNDSKDTKCDELKYISIDAHETMASFKTPSLRNVSKTAPYMHDGQFADLASVMVHYDDADKLVLGNKDLLAVELSKQNQSDLVAFLNALDSEILPLPKWLKSIN